MSTSELSQSALARLERHAKRRGVEIGEMMHLALNALETAEAQPGAQAVSPEIHSGASVTYDGMAGTSLGARAEGRSEEPGGTDRAGLRDGAPNVQRERRRFRVRSESGEAGERIIDPDNPGGVTHTKIREARLDGRTVVRPRWNRLLDGLILRALREGGDFDEIRRLARSKMVRGRKLDQGFVHYPELDVSMQRRDADTACRGIAALATHLGAEIDIGFEWREKEGSRHPGDRGRLRIDAPISKRG